MCFSRNLCRLNLYSRPMIFESQLFTRGMSQSLPIENALRTVYSVCSWRCQDPQQHCMHKVGCQQRKEQTCNIDFTLSTGAMQTTYLEVNSKTTYSLHFSTSRLMILSLTTDNKDDNLICCDSAACQTNSKQKQFNLPLFSFFYGSEPFDITVTFT